MQKYYSQEGTKCLEAESAADGNLTGRSNQTLSCICPYDVEFPGGGITEWQLVLIKEPTYAQCDVNRNGYLLLELLVNYKKDDSSLSIEDQTAMAKGRETSRKSVAG